MSNTISAGMVKELRERTGSGMMECKKALVEANGDMELAIENMRKAGLAKADKKSGRIAAEGIIGVQVSENGKSVVIVDINCETDFVAKADDFVSFVKNVSVALLNADISTEEELLAMPLEDGVTVDEMRRGLISKLGENITIRRFENLIPQKVVPLAICTAIKSALSSNWPLRILSWAKMSRCTLLLANLFVFLKIKFQLKRLKKKKRFLLPKPQKVANQLTSLKNGIGSRQ